MIRGFIKDIVEEKNGFRFDRPHRLREESLSVFVPVVREIRKKRDYITLAEAKSVVIKDTGKISLINVQNNEELPLYINRGAIFNGDTQERAAIHGYIVMPNSNLNVDVRCIHQTKSINTNGIMEYGGNIPYSIDLSSQHNTWESIRDYTLNVSGVSDDVNGKYGDRIIYYGTVTASSVQLSDVSTSEFDLNDWHTNYCFSDNKVYDSIDTHNGYSGQRIFATNVSDEMDENFWNQSYNDVDNLVGVLDEMSGKIKEAMKNIPYIENQVGGVFIEGNGKIIGLDIYNVPKSWQSLKNDIIKKEGASFIDDDDDLFIMRPEKADKLVKKKLNENFKQKVLYSKEYSVVEIKYEDLIGEVVIFNNKIIHLILWNKR